MKPQTPPVEQTTLLNHMLQQFETLEKTLSDSDPSILHRLRTSAITRFEELGFPNTRNEEWRFTPLNTLYSHSFRNATPTKKVPQPSAINIPESYKLVFVDGFYQPSMSKLEGLPKGCTILSLREAIKVRPELVEAHLARHADYENNLFAALNTAFLQDGLFIHLTRECVVEQPIYVQFIESGSGVMTFPRMLFLAEQHSQATLIEIHQSAGETPDLTSFVGEFVLCDEARIDHYRVTNVSKTSFHFVSQHTRQCRGSNFRSHAFTLGGSLVRSDLFANLIAENCEATLNGLYTADGNRLVDNHTVIEHAKPHCNSHEVYKGIIDGKGRGVFNGKIFVRQDAQKTDAKQTNQTLLLSPDATIDTKPQLEIFADDVKCTHGATVGQLDADMLFYLRTRGIGSAEAQAILTYAFANDLISRVEVPALREALESRFLT